MHRHGGEPLLHPELAAMYDAFETPRAVRGDLPILDRAEALEYLADVRARALAILDRDGADDVSRDGAPARAAAHRDDAAGDRARPAADRARASRPRRAAPSEAATSAQREAVPRARVDGRRAGRPLHDGRPERRFSYDNERPRARRRAPRLPHRPHRDHQRHLPALRRGRRLPAPRVVVGRGLGVEGGATTSPTRRAGPPGPRAGGSGASTERRRCTPASRWSTSPGSRPTPSPGPTRARLPTEAEWEKAATWDQKRGASPSKPQPRPARARTPTRSADRPAPTPRRARHARRHVGVDRDRVRRLPRLRRPPVPRVLRGLLPPRLPRPARRLVGHARARGDPDVPQLGPPPATADLLRREAAHGTHDARLRRAAAAPRWPTTRSTASPGRPRSCRPSTSTTPAAPSCSTASASCPSTTRRAPSGRSSRRAPTRSWPPPACASSSSSAPAPRPRRACCSTPWPAPARCGATSRSTSTAAWCRTPRPR